MGSPARCARQTANQWGQTVLLKGAETLVAAPDQPILSVETPASLATAGSGDVLSGSIGALLAQGLAPRDAAALAVYVGNRAAARVSPVSVPLVLLLVTCRLQSQRNFARSKDRGANVPEAKELWSGT